MVQQITFEAIGTQWWIEIFDGISLQELETTKRRLELLCSQFNLAYSRFLPDSFISILNRERVLQNPSEECCALLSYGKKLYLESETAFNFLTGHVQEARGYNASYSFIPTPDHDSLPICNPLTDLEITEHTITLHCGNVDLGGFGKGWLIDKIKDDLLGHGITHFLINGGGDMYVTDGPQGESITIYLEHPTKAQTYIAQTSFKNQGFAASSPFKRQWKHDNTTYSHIVSNSNVPQLASFVKAPSAALADAFGTSSLLLTEEQLRAISAREGYAFARFNPATDQIWYTQNFF